MFEKIKHKMHSAFGRNNEEVFDVQERTEYKTLK